MEPDIKYSKFMFIITAIIIYSLIFIFVYYLNEFLISELETNINNIILEKTALYDDINKKILTENNNYIALNNHITDIQNILCEKKEMKRMELELNEWSKFF